MAGFAPSQLNDEEEGITLAKEPGSAEASDQEPHNDDSGEEERQKEGEQSEDEEEDQDQVRQSKRAAPKGKPTQSNDKQPKKRGRPPKQTDEAKAAVKKAKAAEKKAAAVAKKEKKEAEKAAAKAAADAKKKEKEDAARALLAAQTKQLEDEAVARRTAAAKASAQPASPPPVPASAQPAPPPPVPARPAAPKSPLEAPPAAPKSSAPKVPASPPPASPPAVAAAPAASEGVLEEPAGVGIPKGFVLLKKPPAPAIEKPPAVAPKPGGIKPPAKKRRGGVQADADAEPEGADDAEGVEGNSNTTHVPPEAVFSLPLPLKQVGINEADAKVLLLACREAERNSRSRIPLADWAKILLTTPLADKLKALKEEEMARVQKYFWNRNGTNIHRLKYDTWTLLAKLAIAAADVTEKHRDTCLARFWLRDDEIDITPKERIMMSDIVEEFFSAFAYEKVQRVIEGSR